MSLPATMRAVRAIDKKPALVGIAVPQPGPGEVLVRVKATALNRADLTQVQGFYPPPPGASDVLGLECAGEVVAPQARCDAVENR